jgi:hypothetical protein
MQFSDGCSRDAFMYHSLERNSRASPIGIDSIISFVEPLTAGGSKVDHCLSVDATSSFNNNGK